MDMELKIREEEQEMKEQSILLRSPLLVQVRSPPPVSMRFNPCIRAGNWRRPSTPSPPSPDLPLTLSFTSPSSRLAYRGRLCI
jgi:hypothetical protein